MTKSLSFVLFFATALICSPDAGAERSAASPMVVATSPVSGAADVDPSLSKVTVTFNTPMLDKSWSWSYEGTDSFPSTAGEPFYTDNERTCVLPVRLQPGKRYVIWINTAKLKNFKDKSGRAAEPYKLVFTTRK